MKSIFKMLFVVLILLVANTTNAQTTAMPEFGLTKTDKENCAVFQSLTGQNRLEQFKKILPLIKNENQKIPLPINTIEDIVANLGQPDAIVLERYYHYNLNVAGNACKAVIKFDDKRQIIFCTIKECN